MNFLNAMYVKVSMQWDKLVKNERGSQTLEWIGIAAVIVILVGVISQAFSDEGLGTAVKEKFIKLLTDMG